MLAACYLNAVNIKRKIYRLENFARTSSIANESSRMAFYSTFLFNTFKTLLSVRVFLQRCLPNSVLDEVTAHKMCQPWKGSRDGVVVKALAFHKCASGSIPEPGARHKWVEFVVGSLHCPERFSSRYSSFHLSPKTNIFKFQFYPVLRGHWFLNEFLYLLGASYVRKLHILTHS